MTTLRFTRPPSDNKIRCFPRTCSDNDILHSSKYKRSIDHFQARNVFKHSHEIKNNTQPDSSFSNNNIVNVVNTDNNTNREYVHDVDDKSTQEYVDVKSPTSFANNAFEVGVKNKIIIVREANPVEDKSSDSALGSPLNTPTTDDCNLSDVTDEEIEELPDVDNPKGPLRASIHHIAIDVHGSDKNIISDVQDEQQNQLPKIDTPTRNFLAKSKKSFYQYFQPIGGTHKRQIVNKRMAKLKRSISSIESDEDCTSFFGSIRNRETRIYNDDFDDEVTDPIYFNAYMSVVAELPNTSARLSCNMNRAYSAESFMKKRDSEGTTSDIRPYMSIKNSSSCGDGDKTDFGSIKDRLQIRRGALAEPEKMLISQERRERAEKDVEKRKTFIRKVSQFFNLHLRLNREEDLI